MHDQTAITPHKNSKTDISIYGKHGIWCVTMWHQILWCRTVCSTTHVFSQSKKANREKGEYACIPHSKATVLKRTLSGVSHRYVPLGTAWQSLGIAHRQRYARFLTSSFVSKPLPFEESRTEGKMLNCINLWVNERFQGLKGVTHILGNMFIE